MSKEDEFKPAELNKKELNLLKAVESSLNNEHDSEVVIVAYEKEDEPKVI